MGLLLAAISVAACGGGRSGVGAAGPVDGGVDQAATTDLSSGVDLPSDLQPGDTRSGETSSSQSPDAAPACSNARDSGAGKISPQLQQAYQKDASPRRVFLLYRESPTLPPLPECTNCGGCRTCPERDAVWAQRDQIVTAFQRCVVDRVRAIGGEFLEQFQIGNITLVRLSLAQATDIAMLADVRQLDDADTPGPPPP